MTISPPESGEKNKKVLEDPVKADPRPIDFAKLDKPGFWSSKLSKGPKTTTWIWNLHADAHDFDVHTGDAEEATRKIFSAHFGHLAVIFIWMSAAFFHGARFSNYSGWLADPTHVKPGAQQVWSIVGQEMLNADLGANYNGIQISSGIFHMWRAWGITNESELMALAIGAVVLAALMLHAGIFHYHKAAPKMEWFQDIESMLNHHIAGLVGLGSLAWAGHCIHIGAPTAALLDAIDAGSPLVINGKEIATIADMPMPHQLCDPQIIGQIFPGLASGTGNFFSLNWLAFSDFLTFKGGLNPVTGSLWMTDVSHHHLAFGVIAIIGGHMYRTNYGIGHSMKEILDSQQGDPILFPAPKGHQGLFEFMAESRHAQLAVNLAMLGSISILVSHHMYAMPPYPYIATAYMTVLGLFTHHMWIGGLFIVGAGAHAGIAMVRDYDPAKHIDNVLDRILKARDALISHLNWVCMWLGFHSFGLYIHNDTMRALGRPQDMFSDSAIQLQPIFAQWVQSIQASAVGTSLLAGTAEALPHKALSEVFNGSLVEVGGKVAIAPIPLGTADLMIHHIHAFQIHVTVLILLKGVLYARSSRLIPDKASLGFRFPCDGPGRGGTCDSSSWDAMYLAMFWALNLIAWVTFYWHWKHLAIWQGNVAQFNESGTYLMGWFRDYLWLNSAQLINGYNPFGVNSLSPWAWMFLFGHLVWATGFMFLISWRGYWQELIETLVWAHQRTPIANLVGWRDKPVALSIVQARLVGLAHFTIGNILTFGAFVIASTSGKFG